MLNFSVDQLLQRIIKIERRDEQFVHFGELRDTREAVEGLRKFLGHLFPAGKKAKIRVNLRR